MEQRRLAKGGSPLRNLFYWCLWVFGFPFFLPVWATCAPPPALNWTASDFIQLVGYDLASQGVSLAPEKPEVAQGAGLEMVLYWKLLTPAKGTCKAFIFWWGPEGRLTIGMPPSVPLDGESHLPGETWKTPLSIPVPWQSDTALYDLRIVVMPEKAVPSQAVLEKLSYERSGVFGGLRVVPGLAPSEVTESELAKAFPGKFLALKKATALSHGSMVALNLPSLQPASGVGLLGRVVRGKDIQPGTAVAEVAVNDSLGIPVTFPLRWGHELKAEAPSGLFSPVSLHFQAPFSPAALIIRSTHPHVRLEMRDLALLFP